MDSEFKDTQYQADYNPEEYSLPNEWKYQNSFTYENDNLKDILADV